MREAWQRWNGVGRGGARWFLEGPTRALVGMHGLGPRTAQAGLCVIGAACRAKGRRGLVNTLAGYASRDMAVLLGTGRGCLVGRGTLLLVMDKVNTRGRAGLAARWGWQAGGPVGISQSQTAGRVEAWRRHGADAAPACLSGR